MTQATPEKPVRVLVVENHQVVADGLEQLLNAHSDMVVVGRAQSVAEASARASELRPDVVLTDFHLADGNGAEALAAIRQVNPDARFIVLTREDSDAARLAALEGGASGFIHKSNGAEQIVNAVRVVAGGGTLFTPDVVASLLKKGREIHTLRESLTAREKEVLRLMGAGISSRDMAAKLGISYTTVRAHLRSIDAKLGVHSKVEAVLKARELGVIV
jgi:DNA-binding NarL/FixJ family response regulator